MYIWTWDLTHLTAVLTKDACLYTHPCSFSEQYHPKALMGFQLLHLELTWPWKVRQALPASFPHLQDNIMKLLITINNKVVLWSDEIIQKHFIISETLECFCHYPSFSCQFFCIPYSPVVTLCSLPDKDVTQHASQTFAFSHKISISITWVFVALAPTHRDNESIDT